MKIAADAPVPGRAPAFLRFSLSKVPVSVKKTEKCYLSRTYALFPVPAFSGYGRIIMPAPVSDAFPFPGAGVFCSEPGNIRAAEER